MRLHLLIPTLLLALQPVFCNAAETKGSIDLDECFSMAVRRSETLQMKEEDINVAAAKFRQALGGILPQISFKASEMIQDVPTADQVANAGSISNTFLRRDTPNTAFNMTQSIFSGLKEWRAMAGLKASQDRLKHEHQRAAQLLYQDVAQSFYIVLQVQNDVAILNRQHGVLQKRVAVLRERVLIGRSRKSEIAAAEAQEANVAAILSQMKGTLAVTREMLEFLTGVTAVQQLRDTHTPSKSDTLDNLLIHSDTREDVLAAVSGVEEANSNLKVAKSARSPTVSLSANYYPYRVGFYNQIKWDTTFNLTVPLYLGGSTKAQIDQAKSQLASSQLNEQLARRQSEKDIRSAYATWRSALEQAASYNRAAQKNRENYSAQAGDYEHNLVSNLEVLQAFNDWLTTERMANQLRHQAQLNYVQVLVAAGRIPGME